jgi:hypothetical protein
MKDTSSHPITHTPMLRLESIDTFRYQFNFSFYVLSNAFFAFFYICLPAPNMSRLL